MFFLPSDDNHLCTVVIFLCYCSNPSLRVAYIDEVEEREGGKSQKVYYSVLIKAVDNLDQANIFSNSAY